MLVICANWSVTDGSLGGSRAEAAAAWQRSVHRATLRAGFRHDGRYRPVDDVAIVLAGDTCDTLTSAVWAGSARPWHGSRQADVLRRRVAVATVRRARPLLARLARWARRGLTVPGADRHGRPVLTARIDVPARVVLLAGDRDRWLEDAAGVAARFGCQVGTHWSDGTVDIRHGAETDPLWSSAPPARDTDRAAALAESLLVDLVVRFGQALRAQGAPESFLGDLVPALAAVGPLDWPRVLTHRLSGFPETAALRRTVLDTWRRAVVAWRQTTEIAPPTSTLDGCPLDALAWTLVAPEPDEALERAVATGLWSRLRPPAPAPAASRVVVLGHRPAGSDDTETACAGAIIGLGTTPPQDAGAAYLTPGTPTDLGRHTAVADGPPTIVGFRGPDGQRHWEPLSPGTIPASTIHAGRAGPRLVDAA